MWDINEEAHIALALATEFYLNYVGYKPSSGNITVDTVLSFI